MSANGINLNQLKHKSTIDGSERLVVFSKTKSVPSREVSIDELIARTLVDINDGENTVVATSIAGEVSIDIDYTKGAVTQETAVTTAVTVNASAGVITTVAATTAAGSNFAFTVNNSKVATDSVILLQPLNIGAGIMQVALDAAPSAGSFVVRVYNISDINQFDPLANAFNSVLGLHFAIL
jgi:hypothetical protein